MREWFETAINRFHTALSVVMFVITYGLALLLLLFFLSFAYDILLRVLSVHEGPNRVACMNNLRQIGEACVMYSQDYGGFYPTVLDEATAVSRPMASLALLYGKYVQAKKRTFSPVPPRVTVALT